MKKIFLAAFISALGFGAYAASQDVWYATSDALEGRVVASNTDLDGVCPSIGATTHGAVYYIQCVGGPYHGVYVMKKTCNSTHPNIPSEIRSFPAGSGKIVPCSGSYTSLLDSGECVKADGPFSPPPIQPTCMDGCQGEPVPSPNEPGGIKDGDYWFDKSTGQITFTGGVSYYGAGCNSVASSGTSAGSSSTPGVTYVPSKSGLPPVSTGGAGSSGSTPLSPYVPPPSGCADQLNCSTSNSGGTSTGTTTGGTGTGSGTTDTGTGTGTGSGTGSGTTDTGTGTGSGTTDTGTGTGSGTTDTGTGTGTGTGTTGTGLDGLLDWFRRGYSESPKLEDAKTGDDVRGAGIPSDTFLPITRWRLPNHSSQCPRPQFQAFDRSFTFDAHCTIIEDNFGVIRLAMVASFSLSALLIVLRA